MTGPRDDLSTADATQAIRDHVELLAAMGRDFAGSRDIEQTLRRGLARITDHLSAEGGALFLLDESGETLTCTTCVGATNIEGLTLRSERGIVGRSVKNNRGELVRDVASDPAFFGGVDEKTGFRTKSIVCAPMSVRDECIGAIELVNKKGADPRFGREDLRILETMASSAALAILNAHMAEALVEQERVRRELELAAEIQRSLLPTAEDEAFPVHGVNLPARMVSGDFYDFFTLADGRICFNLGDVSGKAMNAALLMAKTASLYRCLGKTIHRPGRLLARINTEIFETATRGMFVTMVGGIYDPATGRVQLSNAGHEPPLLHRADGTFQAFPAEAAPLGVLPTPAAEASLPEITVDVGGGTLYVFTDGVTEGFLGDGATLGAEGLMRIIRDTSDRPAPKRLRAVTDLFLSGGRSLRDDITMLAIDDAGPAKERSRSPGSPGGEAADTDTEELVELTVPARADRLRLIRHVISLTAAQCGCGEAAAGDLMLAVDEACQNVIRHAYHGDPNGVIVVRVYREGRKLVVLLRDFAEPVDVARIKPRDLADIRPGGLGTHFIRECLDEAVFLPPPPDGGNLMKMVKKIR